MCDGHYSIVLLSQCNKKSFFSGVTQNNTYSNNNTVLFLPRTYGNLLLFMVICYSNSVN